MSEGTRALCEYAIGPTGRIIHGGHFKATVEATDPGLGPVRGF